MSAEAETDVFAFEGFSLYRRQRLLFGPDDEPVPLNGRAFDTLLYLVEHPNQLIDKQALMKAVWPNVIVEENNLNQNISIVRRALGETPGEHRFIVTVPGRGFRFVPVVTPSTRIPPNELLDAARPHLSAPWITAIALVAAVAVLTGYFLVHPFQSTPSAVTTTPARADASVTPEPSIAVLPFVNIGADKDQEYFSDGLTEELFAQLGQLHGLRVVGRTSAFAFKGKNEDLRVIGATLGVDHLLEGSVRKSGSELRITTELVDAKSGSHLWSQVYERKLDDIFSIQEEIAKAVATELSAKLRPDTDDLSMPGTRNIAAYDAYLSAQADLKQFPVVQPSLRGIQELERAVALDPKFVRAWSTLAIVYVNAAGALPVSDGDYFKKSQTALSRALELAPDSPSLRAQVAFRTMSADHDWSVVERGIRQWADGPGASDYQANNRFGGVLRGVGRPHESLQYQRRAVRAEPLALNASVQLQDAYLIVGDWKAAEAEYERSKHIGGDAFFADEEGLLAVGLDRHDPALIRQFYQAHPAEPSMPALEGMDHPAGALALLQSRYRDPSMQASSLNLVVLARFAAYYGAPELALQYLRKAYQSSPYPFFIWHPVFKDTRRLAGFKDLVRELRLVDYWRATGNWGEFCHPVGEDDFECR